MRKFLSIALATALWLPSMHVLHSPDRARVASGLARSAAHDAVFERAVNPEWDFMSRTFTVLGLADRALASGSREELATIDAIVDRTLREERERGQATFTLPYFQGRFRDPEGSSIFLDGELLLMMMARELVAPRPELHEEARLRAARIERMMRRSPALSGESYPNECWTFCNTTALAALALIDKALGTDHRELASAWVAFAKEHLIDRQTGILRSSYTWDGEVKDGAEGSSIWMAAHNLLLVDADFARDQYTRAKEELGVRLLGYGFAREWPRGQAARPDVDSGPIVPMLEASAASSGLAILGAAAFGDGPFLESLLSSLELFGLPSTNAAGERRYLASNRVGDAVLFHALTFGPLWGRA